MKEGLQTYKIVPSPPSPSHLYPSPPFTQSGVLDKTFYFRGISLDGGRGCYSLEYHKNTSMLACNMTLWIIWSTLYSLNWCQHLITSNGMQNAEHDFAFLLNFWLRNTSTTGQHTQISWIIQMKIACFCLFVFSLFISRFRYHLLHLSRT